MRVNDFCMLLHLALFAGYLLAGAGFIVTIVMWATCRDLDPRIDRHGRIAINWIITSVIYGIIFFLLCFVLVGIPLLVVLAICGFVFPIIGAVRASRGEAWDYPLNIHFLSVDPDPSPAPAGPRTGAGGLALGCLLIAVLGGLLLVAVAFLGLFTVRTHSVNVSPNGIQIHTGP
jgi:uncharacterized Tic20 family protein